MDLPGAFVVDLPSASAWWISLLGRLNPDGATVPCSALKQMVPQSRPYPPLDHRDLITGGLLEEALVIHRFFKDRS